MTEKQKRFADEYLIDLNATKAAIRAGYSELTAYSIGQRLLKNVEISDYIDEQIENIHTERSADAKEILEYMTAVMRGETSTTVMRKDKDGTYKEIEVKASIADRIRAAEILGKSFGMWRDKFFAPVMPVTILDDIPNEEKK